jgi:preprotein translocase subunit SecG
VLNMIVLILDVISALFLVVFILLHSGKGGGLSDMFGGGAGLSGGTAVEKRLDKITVFTAITFGLCTFWLAWKWH